VTVRVPAGVPHGGPIVAWSDTHDVGSRDVAAEPSPVQARQWAARVCSRRGLEPTARPTQDVSCIRQAARTLFTGPVELEPPSEPVLPPAPSGMQRGRSGIARVRWPKVGSTRVAGRPGSRTVQTPPGAASRPRSGSLPGRVRPGSPSRDRGCHADRAVARRSSFLARCGAGPRPAAIAPTCVVAVVKSRSVGARAVTPTGGVSPHWAAWPLATLLSPGRSVHLVRLGHIRRYRDWRIANTPKATNPSAAAVSRNLPNGCARIVCIAPSSPCFCRSKVSVA
jgi:hypothetical protein